MNTSELTKAVGHIDLYVTPDGKAYNIREVTLSNRVEVDGSHKRTEQKYAGESFHRIMAKTFIPNDDNLPEVDHIDGDPMNNSLDNLQWITTQANNAKQSFNPKYRSVGVSYEKDRDCWRGYIYTREDGKKKRYRTGRYKAKEDAIEARLELIAEIKKDTLEGFRVV